MLYFLEQKKTGANEPFCKRGAATEHMKNTHAKRGYFECSVVCCDVVRQEGLEPPTYWFVVCHSIFFYFCCFALSAVFMRFLLFLFFSFSLFFAYFLSFCHPFVTQVLLIFS